MRDDPWFHATLQCQGSFLTWYYTKGISFDVADTMYGRQWSPWVFVGGGGGTQV